MHQITVQYAVPKKIPGTALLKRWANAALATRKKKNSCELTIRIVDVDEMTELNSRYRNKKGSTNVLSFPFEMEFDIPSLDTSHILGDIIVCTDVVNREAKEQNKSQRAHWAHMIIHGTLHLLGYDHVKEKDAVIMETLETNILKTLGFSDPYQISAEKAQKNGR
jgi:probable rRNA maturation factor